MFYDWRLNWDDPVIDRPEFLDYNVEEKCKTVVERAQNNTIDQRH